MAQALHIESERCTGCMQCEMACSFENTGAFNPSRSRIKVFTFHKEGRFVPYTCTQCNDAWCMTSCPVDAITLNADTGAKEVNDNACVGCKVCTIACPFGTVNYDAAASTVVKCDLCGGDPWCAKACPTGAITYMDESQAGLTRMRAWAREGLTSAVGVSLPLERDPQTYQQA